MRGQTLLIIGTLIIASAVGGCASSPYESAQHRYDLAHRPRDWPAEWEPILENDAKAFIQAELVDKVNERLASYFGAPHVKVYEFERVVYFEPIPEPTTGPIPIPDVKYQSAPSSRRTVTDIPEGVIASAEWTDRFALAQEMSYRCAIVLAEVKEIDLDSPTPFTVNVSVKLSGQKRHAVASQVHPPPRPPTGYRYWTRSPPPGGFLGMGGHAIYVPKELPGRPHEVGADSLADQAAEALAETVATPTAVTAILGVSYDIQTGQWGIVHTDESKAAALPAKTLSWDYGINSEGREKVYAPR
ncbi:MAG TPA: hypothetical protein ENH80_11020 [Phycisphaerae bacterium]|nr:hypothetical protein [Phycisphaerae bacterium]HDZ44460.1 hypothetical protein [Phycisphaerae bacterium]